MGEKLKIGLIYSYNENWIAGTYYVENLIFALLALPENDAPKLKIYVDSDEDISRLNSRFIDHKLNTVRLIDNQTFFDKLINKLWFLVFGKYAIVKGIDDDVDIIFPNPDTFYFHKFKNRTFWIPDLQHEFLPHLMNPGQLKSKKAAIRKLSSKKVPCVFSSNSALTDYIKCYPENKTRNFVLPFAVSHPEIEGINYAEVLSKHQIFGDYFICCNQFWAHKGHLDVLEALKELKKEIPEISIVFTGKPHDHRKQDHYQNFLEYAQQNKLEEQIKVLGFLSRTDQLILISKSKAIIQPSYFEGWSTVVEDAKALNKEIILSDLDVHKEQLPGYSGFYMTGDIEKLKNKMVEAWTNGLQKPNANYHQKTLEFGRLFKEIVDSIS